VTNFEPGGPPNDKFVSFILNFSYLLSVVCFIQVCLHSISFLVLFNLFVSFVTTTSNHFKSLIDRTIVVISVVYETNW
jgi:hypothetical protein